MKKHILLLIMLAASMGATAKSVVFTLKNGTLVYYLLGGEKNPVMRFTESGITVNADEYEFSDIKNFYISATDDPDGIEQTLAAEKISFSANRFVAKSDASHVSVHAMSGAKVSAMVESAGGYVTVDLSALKQGAYIITIGESSFKVMKK